MKLKTRILFAIPCLAAFIAVTGSAHATTISGTVWTNQAPYTGAPLGPPSGSPAATFDIDGINFNSNGATSYTIGSFLTSGGNIVSNESAGYAGVAGGTLNNTIFDFQGTTFLTAGTYTVTHDDGAYLFLDGGSSNVLTPFNSGTPTSAEDSYFTISTAGTYTYDLQYTEVNESPGVLDAPFATTPEPSSFVLLGSGLLGVAGLVRRRMGV